jgi:hypothetical protein
MKTRSPVTTALLGLFLASGAHANLITNGSFELASVDPGGGFVTLDAGSTAITGWTVSAGNVD